VVPSLPGFAFSDKPVETGWGVNRIARAWATLMPRLGYERWVAPGGDWGAGRRFVGGGNARPGASAAPGPDRGPCELAVRLSRKAAGESHACRAQSYRPGVVVRQRAERLFSRTGDTSADSRLSACGFGSRSGAGDLRKVPGLDRQSRQS